MTKRKTPTDRKWKVTRRNVAKKVKDVIATLGNGIEEVPEPTNTCAPQVWFVVPQEPGLHVMRSIVGEQVVYHAVRATLRDNGISQCYAMEHASTSTPASFDTSYFTQPSFQKISE